ncbi:MAG: HD domain-containing phosphohydrolase [Bdellovibrionales bacterium]
MVEDDDAFRSVIMKSLIKKQYAVSEASNGKVAKEMMEFQNFDLVTSDIQMPHLTGLELLVWIKATHPTPVILMTGFSQALETKTAHETGADDFLAKPFKEADLQEIILKHTKNKQAPTPQAPVDLDPQFCKVSIESFLSDKETECSIYIRISNIKYIKIAHQGGKISEEQVKTYKEKGVAYVYLKKEDFSKIVDFNLRLAKLVDKSDTLAADKKINFMKGAGELILENVFVNGVNKELFQETKEFVVTSMDILTEDSHTMTILEILSSHADFLYSHSLGVSTFSVMIARELGWHSSATLFKLSVGGLMHDIGKKEIDKELLEKSRPLLTQKERRLIETHPTRGKEILESLPTMPSEVVAIAYEHHENILSQGFPRGIPPRDIHPLSKVVSVANIFCELAIKYRTDINPLPAQEAIVTMEKLKSGQMDPAAFKALKKLFKQE